MRASPHTPPRVSLRKTITTTPEDDYQSELKLFTLWNLGLPPPFSTLDQSGEFETKRLCRARANPERWWIVTLSALEVVRLSEQPQRPLTRGELNRSPRAIHTSRLRARLGWGRVGQGHFVDVDIGAGVRLAIEGAEVDVSIVGPRGRMREPAKGDTRTLGQPGVGGLYIDTLVSGDIVPSPGVPSARGPRLTQVLTVSAEMADRSLAIPPFARRLTVTSVGGDLETLSFRVGVTGAVLHEVSASPADPQSTPTVLVPQAATHITTGPALPVPRTLTFSWDLDL